MTTGQATSDVSDEWVSAQSAADSLGDSKVKVLNAVIAGTLVGKWIAGRTVIRRDSVAAEIERRKQSAATISSLAAR